MKATYRVLSVPGKKFDSKLSSVFKSIFYPHFVAMGLISHEIFVYVQDRMNVSIKTVETPIFSNVKTSS